MSKTARVEAHSPDPTHLHESWRCTTPAGLKWELHLGDALQVLQTLESDSFHCIVTSPPYYSQRDYGVLGQIGSEKTISEYVSAICEVMDEMRRVLSRSGVLFLNLGDTYYSGKGQPRGPDRKNGARRMGLRPVDASGLGVPRKTLIGIPWRVALEMIDQRWILRSPIIWKKENPLPEASSHDRPWRTYETVFLFSKFQRYEFDRSALTKHEDIWTFANRPTAARGNHSAAFPDDLVERCLNLGSRKGDWVLDPFVGSGTVMRVALEMGRNVVGIDLKKTFCEHIVHSVLGAEEKCTSPPTK